MLKSQSKLMTSSQFLNAVNIILIFYIYKENIKRHHKASPVTKSLDVSHIHQTNAALITQSLDSNILLS